MKFDFQRGDFFTEEGYRACLSCGYCCTVGPCAVAARTYKDQWKSPCPSLIEKDGQRFCSKYLHPSLTGAQRQKISEAVGGIGSGCSSPAGNTMRDAIRNRLAKKERARNVSAQE